MPTTDEILGDLFKLTFLLAVGSTQVKLHSSMSSYAATDCVRVEMEQLGCFLAHPYPRNPMAANDPPVVGTNAPYVHVEAVNLLGWGELRVRGVCLQRRKAGPNAYGCFYRKLPNAISALTSRGPCCRGSVVFRSRSSATCPLKGFLSAL